MRWSRRSRVAAGGWRVIGRVLDGPASVLVDGEALARRSGLAVVLSQDAR